jgi:hypothetical protein
MCLPARIAVAGGSQWPPSRVTAGRASPLLGRSGPSVGITQTEYDKKARELKDRQTEIGLRIEQHHQGDGDYLLRWKA